MRGRILATLETYPYLVAEQEGVVIGYAYASQHSARAAYRWAVDVTVYIAENARREGGGAAAVRDLVIDAQRDGLPLRLCGNCTAKCRERRAS